MIRVVVAAVMLAIAWPAQAQTPRGFDVLYNLMALDDVLDVMREEGIAYGEDLRDEMFPGRGGADWSDTVAAVYGRDRLKEVLHRGLVLQMEGTDLDPLIDFFQGEAGKRIVTLELTARRAMLDEHVEEGAMVALNRMREDDDPRLGLLERVIAVNDLIESNVVGALNSNFAFYTGLADGGAFGFEITEDQMLSDIWSQEPDIRVETEDWLFSYLALAYDPLNDADIEAYIALSETPEGRALNQALFAAFDVVFRLVSRELGLGAAKLMAGEDI